MQAFVGLLPLAAIDQIVPLRYQVVDRATRGHAIQNIAFMAKGYATIHAAHGLILQFLVREAHLKRIPIVDAFVYRPFCSRFSLVF